jgi:hypothetical protein
MHHNNCRAGLLNLYSHRSHRSERRKTILTGKETTHIGTAIRNAPQHHGPVRNRLIPWHSNRRVMDVGRIYGEVHKSVG